MSRLRLVAICGLVVGLTSSACSDDAASPRDAAIADGASGDAAIDSGAAQEGCGVPGEMLHPDQLERVSHCEVVRGGLNLGDLPITTVDPLAKLRVVEGTLNLFRNEYLQHLRGLRNLERVEGDLLIHNTATLRTLDGLGRLESIGGDLLIDANSDLTSVDGLSALRSIGADLVIMWNARLPQADAERFATKPKVGGKVEITMNGYEL